MGVVLMSKREMNRIDVLARLDGHRLTASAAADLMRLTQRQTHRLLKRYRDGGAAAIADRRRGRQSNTRLSDVVRDHAIALVRKYYADFGPTLAAEKLGERHDVRVSRETLRGWMREAGIRLARAERKLVDERRVLDDVGAPERDPEEEPQCSHGVIENGDVRAVRCQMQLKASDVLEARRVGRSAEERSKILDGADVALLGLWR